MALERTILSLFHGTSLLGNDAVDSRSSILLLLISCGCGQSQDLNFASFFSWADETGYNL